MSAFSGRPGVYKAGVVLLFVASLLFLVGFGAPYWAHAKLSSPQFGRITVEYSYNEGLWMACATADVSSFASVSGCGSYGVSSFPAWFHIVRVLEGLCLIGLCIACIYAMATNCCRTFPGPRRRFIEVLGILGGVLGFAGCMVYVGMRMEKETDSHPGLNAYLTIFFLGLNWKFFWALYMAAIGSGLAVIAAIMVGIGNKPVEAQPTTGVIMTTMTAQPGYAPQPYAAGHPYAAGQPYVVQPGYAPPPKASY